MSLLHNIIIGESFEIYPLLIKTNGIPYRECFLEKLIKHELENVLSFCNILICKTRLHFYTSIYKKQEANKSILCQNF